jgi:FMN phosphatase YigB (HAD superfamily)
VLLELGLAGSDTEVALACHDRDVNLSASMPYADTPSVLKTLKSCGVRIGIIRNIHYDLAGHFDHHGLAQFVDSYTLSFEHGVQKPHPRLFEIAPDQLGVSGADPCRIYARGLDAVLRLVHCA